MRKASTSEIAGLLIRRADASDARGLARMRTAAALERFGGDEAARAAYEELCASFFAGELVKPDSFLHSFVALVDGVIAGAATLSVVPTLPRFGQAFAGRDGRIRDVYVVPAYRRSGIARALMKIVLAEARAVGLDRLALGTSEMGRPLYESIGFVLKDDEMVFEGL